MTTGKTKEQKSWDTFKRTSHPRQMRSWRVENLIISGMSDVVSINANGTVFWLENKALDSWPARVSTYPLRTAFEPGQLPFMREWKKWKGRAFVLLRVEKDYYLLDPDLPLDGMTKDYLISRALLTGKDAIIKFLEELK